METTGRKLYRVRLEDSEREKLRELVDTGKGSREKRRRAHILLLCDVNHPGGRCIDTEIANTLKAGTATVERVRRQCVIEVLDAALERKPQANRRPPKLDGEAEARLTL